MNRDIKFRGFSPNEHGTKTIYLNGEEIKGEWVYWNVFGQIYRNGKIDKFMSIKDGETIIKETVSQYTGLKDKNSKEIYIGDRLTTRLNETVKVASGKFGWCLINEKTNRITTAHYIEHYEVIGNIYENPELLEG